MERHNRTFVAMLREYNKVNQAEWVKYAAALKHAYTFCAQIDMLDAIRPWNHQAYQRVFATSLCAGTTGALRCHMRIYKATARRVQSECI